MGNFSYGYKPRLLTLSDQTFKLFVWYKRIFYFLKTPPHSFPAFSQYVNHNLGFHIQYLYGINGNYSLLYHLMNLDDISFLVQLLVFLGVKDCVIIFFIPLVYVVYLSPIYSQTHLQSCKVSLNMIKHIRKPIFFL